MIHRNNKLISVKLELIRAHGKFELYQELLAMTNYSMTTNALKEQAINNFIIIHPVVVIHKIRSKKYECVAGNRSLNLAKTIFQPSTEIPVVCLEHYEDIELLIAADVLLTHLLFAVKSRQALGQIYSEMSKNSISKLLKDEKCTRASFCREIGFAYNTIFGASRKRTE